MAPNDWGIPGSTVEIYQAIFIPAMTGEWAPRVLALVDPQPGECVLDVACGTGVLNSLAAEAVGPDGAVYGVDVSADMLRQTLLVYNDRYPPITWRECDTQSLPFEDDIFNAAFCQLGLMFIVDKLKALQELRRVLKPDGRLAVMV